MKSHDNLAQQYENSCDLVRNLSVALSNFQEAINLMNYHAVHSNDNNSFSYPTDLSHPWQELCSHIFKSPEAYSTAITQLNYNMMCIWMNALAASSNQGISMLFPPHPKDRRFRHEQWRSNPFYNYILQFFIYIEKFIIDAVKNLQDVTERERDRLLFFVEEIFNAVSPSNFLFTNPEVVEKTIFSNGKNLLDGSKNFLEDVKQFKNNFQVSSVDTNAFEVGENLAITNGDVVYQNDLMQLIKYTPSTEKIYEKPLIIMPAWINKYYILDLQQNNSMVKWLVDQGYTVFMISWVNPDEKLACKSFDDYMEEGPIAAIHQAKKITGQDSVNFVGYCLGGTLLACTAAYLKAKGKKDLNALTFLTSLMDFSEVGKLSMFIDEQQIQELEEKMSQRGFLEGHEMARTFSLLRSNDMIWSFYINNYLLGKKPMAFDVLYWNQDSTRLPLNVHSFYLRNMYLQNKLVKGEISLNGQQIDIKTIDNPCYFMVAERDHIVPWESVYDAVTQHMKLSKDSEFVLAESGHVVGVVSVPSPQSKYGYLHCNKMHKSSHDWLKNAQETKTSWWLHWNEWLSSRSGKKVSASSIKNVKSLEKAPGSYVKSSLYT